MRVESLTGSQNFSTLRAMPHGAPVRILPALTLIVLASASEAHAQLTGDQAIAAANATRSNLPPDTFGGEMMFGALDEDFFVTLALRLNFDRANWGIGFQTPVRLRVVDRDPQNENDFGGLIRREDWDEVSDFLRIIRYVYVGQADKKGPYYVRIGELSGLTVGHGTIMYRYFNGLDTDIWHTGVNAAVNIGAFGAEAVVGDVVSPYIVGGRFTVRPLLLAFGGGGGQASPDAPGAKGPDGAAQQAAPSSSDDDGGGGSELADWFWRKLVVGVSLIADVRAPYRLNTVTATAAMADSHNHPSVAEERNAAVLGFDIGYELLSNELITITPYVDLNKLLAVDSGWGLHLGILWNLSLPLGVDNFIVDARTEYRRVSGDYVGPYFNTTYEIERFQTLAAGGGVPAPKLFAAVNNTGGGRNGVFFDLLAGLPSLLFVGGEYVDYDGGVADGTLRLSLEVPALEIVKFSAFYYRVNVEGMSDLFKLDDKSAIVAQAQIPMYSVFSLNLRWWRVWQLENGQYEAVDDWSVGLGFSLKI